MAWTSFALCGPPCSRQNNRRYPLQNRRPFYWDGGFVCLTLLPGGCTAFGTGKLPVFDSAYIEAALNLEIAWLNAGVDAVIEWQWDGGHVPSEIFGNSLSLYVDTMYGKHVSGMETVRPEAASTAAGIATEPTGTDLSTWVDASEITRIDFTLADVLAYRNSRATKAVPGFDVIDHGQENYVFGNETEDARHWNEFLNDIFQNEECAAALRELFNAGEQ